MRYLLESNSEAKKQNSGCQGLRQGDGELLLNGHGVSDLQDGKAL